jgi:hypothetical protein
MTLAPPPPYTTALSRLRGVLAPILTHSVNFPCKRKPEHPEKTHDFRQSVDGLDLFTRVTNEKIKPTISYR